MAEPKFPYSEVVKIVHLHKDTFLNDKLVQITAVYPSNQGHRYTVVDGPREYLIKEINLAKHIFGSTKPQNSSEANLAHTSASPDAILDSGANNTLTNKREHFIPGGLRQVTNIEVKVSDKGAKLIRATHEGTIAIKNNMN